MRILITGAGFCGTHLVERLLQEGYEVVVWDNFSTCSKENYDYLYYLLERKNNKYKGTLQTIFNIDVSNWEDIKSQILPYNSFDLIYHLAAQPRIQPSFSDPQFTLYNNIVGTINILEFSRINNGIPVILSGSSSCTADYFGNPYSFSKHSQEEICKMYNQTFGIPCCITRFYNVYGPRHTSTGDYATVIAIFEKQFKAGESLTVVGDGSIQRSFTHIDDIIDGLIKISQNPQKSQLFDCRIINLGYNKVWSILEVAKMFNKDGLPHPIKFIPERKGEALRTQMTWDNCQRTCELLNWKAYRDLETYIRDFIKNNK
jgi:UDP-glucose 4-epimerase